MRTGTSSRLEKSRLLDVLGRAVYVLVAVDWAETWPPLDKYMSTLYGVQST